MVQFGVPWLPMRAYVVAFEVSGSVAADPEAFASRMAQVLKNNRENAHLHGVLVPGHGFFYTIPSNPTTSAADDRFHVRYTTDRPLLAFKSVLLQGLSTFQRPEVDWIPAIDIYFAHNPLWHEKAPLKE